MATVFLGLGSNLGSREHHLLQAIEGLKEAGLQIERLSSVHETEPWGEGPTQGRFLNAVAKIQTNLSPRELLEKIKTLEQKLGRRRTVPNAPRTIDIDILLYDDVRLNTPDLTIPHPRMLQRDFVMVPLKEIAPEIAEQLTHANHPQH